ncbi:hypothetical protein AKJ09_00861 [Labilithrix luteola]|uniref:Uncharacterized protein n=2 Tax=Labilithrix luteola TaxID=1391654 RepID=A0A0K1PKZ8_9BACT|nr:hypothetical protein AKJ09_00861 [Labilithrix luteola]
MLTAASLGVVAGGILGGIGWWATANPFVLLGAAAFGLLVGVMVFGAWKKPDDGASEAPERRDVWL